MKNQFKYKLRRAITYIIFTAIYDSMFIAYLIR